MYESDLGKICEGIRNANKSQCRVEMDQFGCQIRSPNERDYARIRGVWDTDMHAVEQ